MLTKRTLLHWLGLAPAVCVGGVAQSAPSPIPLGGTWRFDFQFVVTGSFAAARRVFFRFEERALATGGMAASMTPHPVEGPWVICREWQFKYEFIVQGQRKNARIVYDEFQSEIENGGGLYLTEGELHVISSKIVDQPFAV